MRTEGVKKLVNLALLRLPQPYTEDVIEDAFLEIENGEELKAEYDGLCKDLGKTTVNAWGGYWIANALGKTGVEQVPAKRSKLLQSYSRLTAAAPALAGKRKEPAALQLMADYYHENKVRLHASVRNHREIIIEMLVAGLPVEQAFAMVPNDFTPPAPVQRRR